MFVEARDWLALEQWTRNTSNVGATLISLLFDENPLSRWRAVEAMGVASRVIADTSLEKVRRVIRRLIWQMNDESGGVIWNAPESLGEILACVPELAPEYNRILAYYLYTSPFERGVHWGMARICEVTPEIYNDYTPMLVGSLRDEDPFIRYQAARALVNVGNEEGLTALQRLANDENKVKMYDRTTGEFGVFPVNSALLTKG